MPEGLTLNENTLKISGTITADASNYSFRITAYDTVYEASVTAQFNLKVKPKSVSKPVAKTNLVYNGENQNAFANTNAEGYSLTNYLQKDAGNYTATVSLLNSNFIWSDETIDDKQISWSIGKKTLTITGVTAQNRLVNGTNQVELSGGTLVGVCGQDNVGFDLNKGTINQTTSGEKLAVTTNIVLDAESQNNYDLTQPNNIKVDVHRIELTLEHNDVQDSISKVYLEYNSTKLYTARVAGQVTTISVPTKETYTLQGYFTENSAGTKMIGIDGDNNIELLFTTLTNDTMLYAHWLKTSFRVLVKSYSNTQDDKKTYKNNSVGGIIIVEGEEGNIYSYTLTGKTKINVKAVANEEYEFDGWYNKQDMKGEPISTDLEMNINLEDEDITLYAKFTKKSQMSKVVKYGIIASGGVVFLMVNVILATRLAKKHKRKTRSKRFILPDLDF